MPHHATHRFLSGLCAAGLVIAGTIVSGYAQGYTSTAASSAQITVGTSVIRDTTNPLQLGFNVEWADFQGGSSGDGILWDSTSQAPTSDLTGFLQDGFPGSMYRYPGGTLSNLFEWKHSIGAVGSRAGMNANYGSSYVATFGLDEFMAFVNQVGGTPLIQLNIASVDGVGLIGGTTDPNWAECKKRALGLMEYLNAPATADWNGDGTYDGQTRQTNGHSAYNVQIVELGNELDLGASGLSATDYSARCADIITTLRAKMPNLKFIAHARTNPWDTSGWAAFHQTVLAQVGSNLTGIAWHPYYDGYDIPDMLKCDGQIYNDINSAVTANSWTTTPGIYVTEHGRWPWGTTVGANTTWSMTTDIAGSIGAGDFLITQAFRPEVKADLDHALGSVSPWALFDVVNADGSYNISTFQPRPLAYTLRLLNRTLYQAQVIGTTLVTPRASNYGTSQSNPYDLRVAAYRYGASGSNGLLVANRATARYPLKWILPSWVSGEWVVRQESVGGDDTTGGSIVRRYLPVTVASNQGTVPVQARGVFNYTVVGQNLLVNGGFESSSTSSTGWEVRTNGGSGSFTLSAGSSTANTVEGANLVHMARTSTAGGGYELAQTYWNGNGNLSSTGVMALNPWDSYVLRGHVRTTGLNASSASIRLQLFDINGNVSSAASSAAATNSGSTWQTLSAEVVPGSLLNGIALGRVEAILGIGSSVGSLDADGFTLIRRQNWLQNPGFTTGGSWSPRGEGSGTGTITIAADAATGLHYARLVKTSTAGDIAYVQSGGTNLAGLSSIFSLRQSEKWRLRAHVRATGLNSSGAKIRLQVFDTINGFRSSSPSSATVTGGTGTWQDLTIDFCPRQILNGNPLNYAEVLLTNSSTAGTFDVGWVSLEALDVGTTP